MWVATNMLPLMGMDYTTLRVYRYRTFTCITTHSSITGVSGTLLCHQNDRYRAQCYAVALGTETVPPYEEERWCCRIRRWPRPVWWRQRPTHQQTPGPTTRSSACEHNSLSQTHLSLSVSLVILLPTYFLTN